jgi:hypothetical protein
MFRFIVLLTRKPRSGKPARRSVDPVMTFSPREWADLPVHHPRSDLR